MTPADLETLVELVVLGVLETGSGLSIPGYQQETNTVRDNAPYYTVSARITGEHIPGARIYDLAVEVQYVSCGPVEAEETSGDPQAPNAGERSTQYAALFGAITLPALMSVGFIGAVDMPQSTKRTSDGGELDYTRSFTFTVIAADQTAS